MKKLNSITAVVLALTLILSGCGSKPAEVAENTDTSRTQTIESLGLKYTVPEEWDTIVDTNVFRFIVAPDDAFAMVRYSYATNQDLETMANNPFDTTSSLDDYLTPICSILIFERDDEDSEGVNALMENYKSAQKLSEQGNYIYYGLWDYSDTSKIDSSPSSLDKEGYKKLTNSAPKLMNSVETFDFDPDEIISQTTDSKETMTFLTQTLSGEEISSVIFDSYDITMVYFWASYCYPDINELPELQKVYETMKESYPNANLILAAIDTPDENAEAVLKQAVEENGCTFTVIKMDELLGSWVLSNLEGLPTTVYVDKEGHIVDQYVQGLQGSEVYLNIIQAFLANK